MIEEVSWIDGNMQEDEISISEPDMAELERERIAQEKHEELMRQRAAAEADIQANTETIAKAKEIIENPPIVIETVHVTDPKLEEEIKKLKKEKKELLKAAQPTPIVDPALVEELELLRVQKDEADRARDAAEKAREETILAMRNKATRQKETKLNLVEQRTSSLWSSLTIKVQQFLRKRRIKTATVGIKNYEQAIINQTKAVVPKMLDEIEKMHEQLTILEELLVIFSERQKIKDH